MSRSVSRTCPASDRRGAAGAAASVVIVTGSPCPRTAGEVAPGRNGGCSHAGTLAGPAGRKAVLPVPYEAAAAALTRLPGAWPPAGRRSLAGGSVRDEASDARRRLDVPVFAQQAQGRP